MVSVEGDYIAFYSPHTVTDEEKRDRFVAETAAIYGLAHQLYLLVQNQEPTSVYIKWHLDAFDSDSEWIFIRSISNQDYLLVIILDYCHYGLNHAITEITKRTKLIEYIENVLQNRTENKFEFHYLYDGS